MWWKIAGVWLASAVLFALLSLIPIPTHAVMLTDDALMARVQAENPLDIAIAVGGLLLLEAFVVVPALLTRRILRKHRASARE